MAEVRWRPTALVYLLLFALALAAFASIRTYLSTFEACGFDNGGTWAAGMARGASPLDFTYDSSPVITCASVTDLPAGFVADTFILPPPRDGSIKRWYMFFEVLSHIDFKGDLGFAYSDDAHTWTYGGLVMDEKFHLSYPFVFREKGKLYMIPETGEAFDIRLYTAKEDAQTLPTHWTLVSTLISGIHKYRDNSVVFFEGLWYMWTLAEPHCRLFVSSELGGPWKEHPKSPLEIDPAYRRPGGRPVVYNGKVYRYAQENYHLVFNYGRQNVAILVDVLNSTHYSERVVKSILPDPSVYWISQRIHNVDPHELAPGKWVFGVDGDSQLNVPLTRFVIRVAIATVVMGILVALYYWRCRARQAPRWRAGEL